MSRSLSLLFAVIGTALIVGIAGAMSYGSVWGTVLFSLGTVAFLAFAFILKARLRRRNEAREKAAKSNI